MRITDCVAALLSLTEELSARSAAESERDGEPGPVFKIRYAHTYYIYTHTTHTTQIKQQSYISYFKEVIKITYNAHYFAIFVSGSDKYHEKKQMKKFVASNHSRRRF